VSKSYRGLDYIITFNNQGQLSQSTWFLLAKLVFLLSLSQLCDLCVRSGVNLQGQDVTVAPQLPSPLFPRSLFQPNCLAHWHRFGDRLVFPGDGSRLEPLLSLVALFKGELDPLSLTIPLLSSSAGSENFYARLRWLTRFPKALHHSSPAAFFKSRASTLGSSLSRASVNSFLDRRSVAATSTWNSRTIFLTLTSRSFHLMTNVQSK
jgi:hypothetical protein